MAQGNALGLLPQYYQSLDGRQRLSESSEGWWSRVMANARHSKTARFVRQRLFSGLSAFFELERRIADLPDEKACGDAFEVFTEAYLATQRKHDAEMVWLLPSVPSEILGNLQLATLD